MIPVIGKNDGRLIKVGPRGGAPWPWQGDLALWSPPGDMPSPSAYGEVKPTKRHFVPYP